GSVDSRIKNLCDDERVGGCILTVDGITVGVEVCLDHIARRVEGGPKGRLAPYADKVQLQLIPSFGMTIKNGLFCMNGGVVFNVDGRRSGTSEVKVKGNNTLLTRVTHSPKNARGTLDLWGTFPIPRHGSPAGGPPSLWAPARALAPQRGTFLA